MASVRQKGKRFYITYKDATGQPVKDKAVKARTLTQARKLAADLEQQAERQRLGLESGIQLLLVRELWERYEPFARKKRSWKSLEGRFRLHILPFMGDEVAQHVRPADVEELLVKKADEGLSAQTCEHLRVHLCALFTFAIRKLQVMKGENPARVADRPEILKKPIRFLEPWQVERLLAKVPAEWRPFFATACYTGLRKGELCGLLVRYVDLRRRLIAVVHSYEYAPKSGKVRHVPISEELLPYLEEQLARTKGLYLFPSASGGMLTKDFDAAAMLRTALKKAGLVEGFDFKCRRKGCDFEERRKEKPAEGEEPGRCPKCGMRLWVKAVPLAITFKHLRSTAGTAWYEATGDLRAVQELHGHADPRTTEGHYASLRAGRLIELANKVSFRDQPQHGQQADGQPPSDSLPIPPSEERQRAAN